MLFRDNLIISLVLVYRSKENLGFYKKQIVPLPFFIPYSTFLHLSPAVERKQAHLPGVFKKQECQVTYFCEKNKCIKLQTFS